MLLLLLNTFLPPLSPPLLAEVWVGLQPEVDTVIGEINITVTIEVFLFRTQNILLAFRPSQMSSFNYTGTYF